jgi:hypothetical protein
VSASTCLQQPHPVDVCKCTHGGCAKLAAVAVALSWDRPLQALFVQGTDIAPSNRLLLLQNDMKSHAVCYVT